MIEITIFLFGSLGFIILSRASLIRPFSHGFPRFFAFEFILGLIALNAHHWIDQPFSLPQSISWVFLMVSVYLMIHGYTILQKFGRADYTIQDANRIGLEKTTRLVAQGPYQFIRHPMYASLLLLTWGVFFKQINLLSGLLAILASLTLLLTAVLEERENLQIFGKDYASYMSKTKRFLPFVF